MIDVLLFFSYLSEYFHIVGVLFVVAEGCRLLDERQRSILLALDRYWRSSVEAIEGVNFDALTNSDRFEFLLILILSLLQR